MNVSTATKISCDVGKAQGRGRDWRVSGSIILAIAAAVILWLMGQPLWCKCGTWSPWSWDIWSPHNSQHLIDPYTASHVLHGVIFCGLFFWLPRAVSLNVRFLTAIVLEVGWEILENSPIIIERYRAATIATGYSGDSVINSVADILACAIGYVIAFRLRAPKSLMLFAATELVVLACVRDCLILNVVMLIYPIEAIKVWQMARL